MKNWFRTLNEALDSENLVAYWPMGLNINYGEIEDAISTKLIELDELVVGIEFILNVESIAETVQPETDRILNRL